MTRKWTGIRKLTSKSQSRAIPSAALKMNVKATPHDAAVRRKRANGDVHRTSRAVKNASTGIRKQPKERIKSDAFVQSMRCRDEKIGYGPPGEDFKNGSISI